MNRFFFNKTSQQKVKMNQFTVLESRNRLSTSRNEFFPPAERYQSQHAILHSFWHITFGFGDCRFLTRDRGREFGQYHCGGRRFPPTFHGEKTGEIGSNEWYKFEPNARRHMFDQRSQRQSPRELNYFMHWQVNECILRCRRLPNNNTISIKRYNASNWFLRGRR